MNEPGTMILTRHAALKYFGTEDAVGSFVKIGDKYDKDSRCDG